MEIISPPKTTLTRESLAKTIKRETGLNINKASEIVDQILTYMISNMVAENEVKIRMFGSFFIKEKSARLGRNPQTMIEAEISARKVVRFKVASKLKKRINDNIYLIS